MTPPIAIHWRNLAVSGSGNLVIHFASITLLDCVGLGVNESWFTGIAAFFMGLTTALATSLRWPMIITVAQGGESGG